MSSTKAKKIDLHAVCAREIMKTDLVTLSASDPISAAVRTFEEYHITGAPVVDAGGRAIGVLSVADIARGEGAREGRMAVERHEYYLSSTLDEGEGADSPFAGEEALDKHDYSEEVLGDDRVEQWMTPKVISVDPDTDLAGICATMVDESIHRVLVTEEDRVLGIVSTFDIVRFLVRGR